MAPPKQTDPQFKLRMPKGLKDQLDSAVETSGRTLNAEIIWRLQRTFELDAYQDERREYYEQLKASEPGQSGHSAQLQADVQADTDATPFAPDHQSEVPGEPWDPDLSNELSQAVAKATQAAIHSVLKSHGVTFISSSPDQSEDE